MILILLMILFSTFYNCYWKRRRFPPGPMPLPLLGNVHQIDLAYPHRTMLQWRREFGPVFTVWLPKPVVVIADHETLEKTLVQQGDAFSGRPSSFLYRLFTGDHPDGDGIILSQGKRWQSQRGFALRTLKQFGFGRNELETRIAFHVDRLLQHVHLLIGDREYASVDLHEPVAFAIGNIIHDLVLGRVYEFGDEEFTYFKKLIDSTLKQVQSVQLLLADCFPWLAPLIPAFHCYRQNGLTLQKFFLNEVDKHERNLNKDEEAHDFMAAFLQEKQRSPGDPNFNRLTLALDSGDLWTGGMETTVTTLRWAVIYLIHYPTVQDNLHQEIENVLGAASVSYSDRSRLPYTGAFICEVQRLANVLPWNIPHSTTRTATAGSYVLPPGTDILPFIGAPHHDPALFTNPEHFDPDRFLDEFGCLCVPAFFTPFGRGRRACLGEHLARVELLLSLVTLLQHFQFEPPASGELPSLARSMGMTSVPKEFECIIRKRKD